MHIVQSAIRVVAANVILLVIGKNVHRSREPGADDLGVFYWQLRTQEYLQYRIRDTGHS